MVCYSSGSRVFAYRCRTKRFGLGCDEASAIADALNLVGAEWENIEEMFRRAKKVVQDGWQQVKVRGAFGRLPEGWTHAQFHNDIAFAAADAAEGKKHHFNF